MEDTVPVINKEPLFKKDCPMMQTFAHLSKKWILPVLIQISHGKKHFSSYKNNLGGISSRTLSLRLKELQKHDFIKREIISEQPLRIEYSLSEKGEDFMIELKNLRKWGDKWK